MDGLCQDIMLQFQGVMELRQQESLAVLPHYTNTVCHFHQIPCISSHRENSKPFKSISDFLFPLMWGIL